MRPASSNCCSSCFNNNSSSVPSRWTSSNYKVLLSILLCTHTWYYNNCTVACNVDVCSIPYLFFVLIQLQVIFPLSIFVWQSCDAFCVLWYRLRIQQMKEAYIVKLGERAKGTHFRSCSHCFSIDSYWVFTPWWCLWTEVESLNYLTPFRRYSPSKHCHQDGRGCREIWTPIQQSFIKCV